MRLKQYVDKKHCSHYGIDWSIRIKPSLTKICSVNLTLEFSE